MHHGIRSALLAAVLPCITPFLAAAATTGNLVANPSFEDDWINAKAEKQLISGWGEHGFGQCDLKPDAWRYRVPVNPDERTVVWDAAVAHGGRRSLRMQVRDVKGRVVFPSALQDHLYAGYQGELGKDVFASDRKAWRVKGLPLSAAEAPRFFRKIRLSAWCRAEGVPEGARISAQFDTFALQFPVGTYDWQRQEIEISPEDQAIAFTRRLKGQDAGPLPASRRVMLRFTPAKKDRSGTVWFDDIRVEEELPPTPNRALNSSFEQLTPEGMPTGWSGPEKFRYVPPTWYYVWRDWSHFFSRPRGKATADNLIARSGRQSLRFSVRPGDEMLCQSDPITINQDAARILEVGLWLKADKIRYFDLRVVDERGVHLNSQSLIAGTHDRERGSVYRGTFDWRYFRKFFLSDHPVRALRVELCARGFNGLHIDDVGKKATNNQVGTLWWDDLLVTDPLSGAKAQRAAPPPRPTVHVADIDFGQRLYGENEARLTIRNDGGSACAVSAELSITPPHGKTLNTRSAPITIAPRGKGTLRLPYEIWAICPDWRSQYHAQITVLANEKAIGTTDIDFGTWPELGRVEVERVYAHPDESTNQHVWVNFGVSDTTFAKVTALRYDLVHCDSRKVVKSVPVAGFQTQLRDFRKTQPYQSWWTDEFHLYLRPLDVSSLPVHPADKPVRDHKAAIVALTGESPQTELFRCESVPFGLVQPNAERLDPIQSVQVKGGVTYVNGKPFFLRACLGHWWRNEPAPSQRHPWVATSKGADKKVIHDFASAKAHGFNSFWPNTPYELDYADRIWDANLYTAVWYPKGWRGLAFDDRHGDTWKCKSTAADFEAAARHPSMFLISLTAWEGGMPHALYADEKLLKAQAEFADEVRRLTRRPLFFSGGYSAHKQQYGTMWDVFGPESNWDGPSRVRVTGLHPMRRLGKDVSGMDFPNIFNDMAFDLIRFETYEGIVRGQRGFAQIGRWGDNSLYRGLNGELRYLERFIFAPESAPALSVEPVNPVTTPSTVSGKPERYLPKVSVLERTVAGKTYVIATNAQPIRQGDWTWTERTRFSGRRSHTGDSTFCRSYPERFRDWHVHGYRDDKPVEIKKSDVIVQHVLIPDDANVETLVLMVDGNGCWNHNAVWGKFDFDEFRSSKIRFRLAFELYRWLWSSIGIGHSLEAWRDEHYSDVYDRDFLRKRDFRPVGALPGKGRWVKLTVPAERLGLVGKLTTGFEFVSRGDRVWWDYTAIERQDEMLVLCDDVLGAGEQELSQIRFSGCKPGAVIRIPFEDRSMKADERGTFTDDFRGQNVYDKIWEGMLGDKTAPDVYYGGGYHYNYPNAAVHIYEIE